MTSFCSNRLVLVPLILFAPTEYHQLERGQFPVNPPTQSRLSQVPLTTQYRLSQVIFVRDTQARSNQDRNYHTKPLLINCRHNLKVVELLLQTEQEHSD